MTKYNAVVIITEDLDTMNSLGLFDTKEEAEQAIQKEKSVRARLGSKFTLNFSKVLEIKL